MTRNFILPSGNRLLSSTLNEDLKVPMLKNKVSGGNHVEIFKMKFSKVLLLIVTIALIFTTTPAYAKSVTTSATFEGSLKKKLDTNKTIKLDKFDGGVGVAIQYVPRTDDVLKVSLIDVSTNKVLGTYLLYANCRKNSSGFGDELNDKPFKLGTAQNDMFLIKCQGGKTVKLRFEFNKTVKKSWDISGNFIKANGLN